MQAAIIVDGKVDNIIEIEDLSILPDSHIVPAEGAAIGDAWDGEIFIPAPAPPAPPEVRHMTVLAFRNRFTKSEKVRIELAAIDDPAADQALRERAATVRIGQADLAAATYVDVDRADTREDVLSFEAMGLLDDDGRALAILDDPIQAHERYNG